MNIFFQMNMMAIAYKADVSMAISTNMIVTAHAVVHLVINYVNEVETDIVTNVEEGTIAPAFHPGALTMKNVAMG